MNVLAVAPTGAVAMAVIAHPHPDFGGKLHNPVVTALHEALVAANCATLRFDFSGSHQPHADLAEAEAIAAERFGDLALIRAGYSFGADTVLTADTAAHIGEVLVAPPFAVFGESRFRVPRPADSSLLAPTTNSATPTGSGR